MAAFLDNVKMTVSGAPGTGTVTLLAAFANNCLSMSEAGAANATVYPYRVDDGTDCEEGIGTYTSSGTTFSRDTVTYSKIGGTKGTTKLTLTSAAIFRIVARSADLLSMTTTQAANKVLAGPGSGSAATPTFRALVGADLPATSFRNVAGDNGGFEIWQRGAGDSANIAVAASVTAYCADRWYLKTAASQAFHVSAQAGLNLGSRLCARVQRDSGQTGTGTVYWEYPLTKDECALIAGSALALSFSTATGANWSPSSGTLTYNLYCGTGTEGKRNSVAFTGESNPLTGSVNLATGASAAQTSAVSSTVASTTTQACIQFSWAPAGTAGANDWVSFDDLQLEIGAAASPFERLPFRYMLAECERHFRKTFSYNTAPAQNAGTTGTVLFGAIVDGALATYFSGNYPFSTRMRSAPTMTLFNPSASNASWRNTTGSTDYGPPTATASEQGVSFTSGAGLGASSNIQGHFTADAGL